MGIMSVLARVTIVAVLTAAAAAGADDSKLWKSSVAALAIASASDMWTTTHIPAGAHEANPAGVRGVMIAHAGILAVGIPLEVYLAKRNPRAARIFTIVNFSFSAEFGALAIHNAGVR